jgi:ubiquinone/menaquinone biosynthesis C-methylase UbiE
MIVALDRSGPGTAPKGRKPKGERIMTSPLTSPIEDHTSPAPTQPRVEVARPPAQFVGSIPEDYDRHLGPLLFDFSGHDMARRVEAGLEGQGPVRVLEVACGTGISTEHLWRQLPSGTRIVATDLSPAMLDHATRHRGKLPGVSFEQASADALPFEDGSFDALVCQFGIMFFDDKPAALAEFSRVLRPGGLLAFSVWESHDRNPVVGLAHRTIGSFFESDPPGFLELPFSYHDIWAIQTLVGDANFRNTEVWRVRETVHTTDATSIARGFVMGNPCVVEIRERGSADADQIIRTLAERIEMDFATEEATGGPADGDGMLVAVDFEEITFTARRR